MGVQDTDDPDPLLFQPIDPEIRQREVIVTWLAVVSWDGRCAAHRPSTMCSVDKLAAHLPKCAANINLLHTSGRCSQ